MKKLMMGVVAAMAMGVMAEAVNTVTQTTPVPVPYAWLDAHVPGIAHEAEAYEAAAKATAANGRPVWACYALGLDPQDATALLDGRRHADVRVQPHDGR